MIAYFSNISIFKTAFKLKTNYNRYRLIFFTLKKTVKKIEALYIRYPEIGLKVVTFWTHPLSKKVFVGMNNNKQYINKKKPLYTTTKFPVTIRTSNIIFIILFLIFSNKINNLFFDRNTFKTVGNLFQRSVWVLISWSIIGVALLATIITKVN